MLKGIIYCSINFFLVLYSLQDQCFDEKGNFSVNEKVELGIPCNKYIKSL